MKALLLHIQAAVGAKKQEGYQKLYSDQQIIAGLGNIYADECLALSGILPMRKACSLSAAEVGRLCEAVNAVIAQGIKNRGTTFRDYKDGEGNKGDNQNHLLVYGIEAVSPVKNAARCCRQPR